jgi:hypothetical protein
MGFPDGFTGFYRLGEAPHPSVDVRIFKSTCYAAARLLDGRVVEFSFAHVIPNFHSAIFEWGHEPHRVALLCNQAYYIVAFCKPWLPDCCLNEYVDAAELASALAQVSDWQVLSKAEVETVLDEAAIQSMSDMDRKVVDSARRKGWFGPTRTVGDFLFHYSD